MSSQAVKIQRHPQHDKQDILFIGIELVIYGLQSRREGFMYNRPRNTDPHISQRCDRMVVVHGKRIIDGIKINNFKRDEIA